MAPFLHSLFFRLRYGFLATEGRDLIEYALLAALISCGAVAGNSRISNARQSACPATEKTSGNLISLTSRLPPRRPARLWRSLRG